MSHDSTSQELRKHYTCIHHCTECISDSSHLTQNTACWANKHRFFSILNRKKSRESAKTSLRRFSYLFSFFSLLLLFVHVDLIVGCAMVGRWLHLVLKCSKPIKCGQSNCRCNWIILFEQQVTTHLVTAELTTRFSATYCRAMRKSSTFTMKIIRFHLQPVCHRL